MIPTIILQSTDFSSLDNYNIYLGEMCLNTNLQSTDFSSLDSYYIYLGAISRCSISGGSINIPTPQIKIKQSGILKPTGQPATFFKGQIFAQYLPTNDTSWQNNEPKYYLFRHRDSNSVIKLVKDTEPPIRRKIKRKAGWYHPTNLGGSTAPIGGRVYSGITGENIFSTEYEMVFSDGVVKPYTYLPINVNPFDFTQFYDSRTELWRRMNEDGSDFGQNIWNYRVTGKKHGGRDGNSFIGKPRQQPICNTFVIAIGIKNPDTTDLNNPILFGNFSEQFRLRIQAEKNIVEGDLYPKGICFHWDIQTSSVPRFIRSV